MLDLCLAIAHHLLIFALFGVLVAELVLLHAGVDQRAVARIVTIDAFYGALAALIVVVGFSRAVFAAKGWDSTRTTFSSGEDRDVRLDRTALDPANPFLFPLASGGRTERRANWRGAALSLDRDRALHSASHLRRGDGARVWRNRIGSAASGSLQRRAEPIEQEGCAALARAVVEPVEIGALFGDRKPRSSADRLKLDGRKRDRELALVMMHLIRVDEPLIRDYVEIDRLEIGGDAARPAPFEALAPAGTHVHLALHYLIALAAAEPAGFGSLVCQGANTCAGEAS